MKLRLPLLSLALAATALLAPGCGKSGDSHAGHDHEKTSSSSGHGHEHVAPHDGTAVVLGDEFYHVEFVLDAAAGKLSAYILDGHMEEYVRCAMPAFDVVATVGGGAPQTLTFKAIADAASGEKVGDTSLFEASADWLKTTREFDAVITQIEVKKSAFSAVAFNFPKGNSHDEAKAK